MYLATNDGYSVDSKDITPFHYRFNLQTVWYLDLTVKSIPICYAAVGGYVEGAFLLVATLRRVQGCYLR